jgi:hypothetical protein
LFIHRVSNNIKTCSYGGWKPYKAKESKLKKEKEKEKEKENIEKVEKVMKNERRAEKPRWTYQNQISAKMRQ